VTARLGISVQLFEFVVNHPQYICWNRTGADLLSVSSFGLIFTLGAFLRLTLSCFLFSLLTLTLSLTIAFCFVFVRSVSRVIVGRAIIGRRIFGRWLRCGWRAEIRIDVLAKKRFCIAKSV